MEAIMALTQNINVFVRFFESINNSFCQIRWLERNIRNSSSGLLLTVGGILLISLYLIGGTKLASILGIPGLDYILTNYGPILIIVLIVCILFFRRVTQGAQSGGGFDNILFGADRNEVENFNDDHRLNDVSYVDDVNRRQRMSRMTTPIYMGIPTAPPK